MAQGSDGDGGVTSGRAPLYPGRQAGWQDLSDSELSFCIQCEEEGELSDSELSLFLTLNAEGRTFNQPFSSDSERP